MAARRISSQLRSIDRAGVVVNKVRSQNSDEPTSTITTAIFREHDVLVQYSTLLVRCRPRCISETCMQVHLSGALSRNKQTNRRSPAATRMSVASATPTVAVRQVRCSGRLAKATNRDLRLLNLAAAPYPMQLAMDDRSGRGSRRPK